MRNITQNNIPQNWEIKKLGDVADILRGVTYAKKDEIDFSDKCILRSNNITLNGYLDLEKLKYIHKDISDKKRIIKDDIMICMSNGSKNHVGKVCYFGADTEYFFGGFMGIIRIHNTHILSKYLYAILNSGLFKSYVSTVINGTNINNLNNRILSSFKIPIPPLSEQTAFMEQVSVIENMIAERKSALVKAEQLFESTLNKAFKGHL